MPNAFALLVTTALLGLSTLASATEPVTPKASATCIAPSGPGGGWDFTCRSVGRTLTQLGLVKNSVQTVNMPGAGGGVAYAHIVSKRDSDPDLIAAASTATPARLAQNQFPGMNVDQMYWIGAVGADYGIIAVRDDSPYLDLSALMQAVREDPLSVSFAGGSATGGWDHLKVLMTADKAGIASPEGLKYLSYNNAGDAATQVAGGHVDAFTGNISQALGFYQSGDFRILAVLAEERLPGEFADIPTAREQGIDAIAPTWRGFYAPGGISDAQRNWWVAALDQLNQSDEWKAVMAQNGLMPFAKTGENFERFVRQQIDEIRRLSQQVGLM